MGQTRSRAWLTSLLTHIFNGVKVQAPQGLSPTMRPDAGLGFLGQACLAIGARRGELRISHDPGILTSTTNSSGPSLHPPTAGVASARPRPPTTWLPISAPATRASAPGSKTPPGRTGFDQNGVLSHSSMVRPLERQRAGWRRCAWFRDSSIKSSLRYSSCSVAADYDITDKTHASSAYGWTLDESQDVSKQHRQRNIRVQQRLPLVGAGPLPSRDRIATAKNPSGSFAFSRMLQNTTRAQSMQR